MQKLPGRQGPRIPSRIGGRMPAYCTGVGKAMLAFAPPERLAAVRGERARAAHAVRTAPLGLSRALRAGS